MNYIMALIFILKCQVWELLILERYSQNKYLFIFFFLQYFNRDCRVDK